MSPKVGCRRTDSKAILASAHKLRKAAWRPLNRDHSYHSSARMKDDAGNAVRILFVEQAVGFGGSLIVISHLLRCLHTSDFTSVFVGEMPEDILRYHVRDRAKLKIVRHPLNYVHRARFSRLLKRYPYRLVHRIGMYAFTLASTFANLTYAVRLAAIIIRERIDIVHINQPDNSEAVITALALKRKVIIHAHGTGHLGPTYRSTMHAIDHFVAISEHVKSYLLSKDIAESRISTIPNPTVVKKLSLEETECVRTSYGITAHQKVFGIFGRLVPWKGQMEFLAAAEIVLGSDPDARAFIVGDVSDGTDGFLAALRRVAERSRFADRITFTGHVLEVERMYSVMDVVVHASIEPEPFGLVIAEAMALGIPVVASNLGATSEIITDGYDGLIVDPRRPDDMASAITRLLRNDQLRMTMGDRARENVERKYNCDLYAQRMGEAYRSVLGLSSRKNAQPQYGGRDF